jgi:hypothetical protein
MPARQPPAFRFLAKDTDGKLSEIGTAWKTSKADTFSVRLDPEGNGGNISCIMVPNVPKAKAKPTSDLKPAA